MEKFPRLPQGQGLRIVQDKIVIVTVITGPSNLGQSGLSRNCGASLLLGSVQKRRNFIAEESRAIHSRVEGNGKLSGR